MTLGAAGALGIALYGWVRRDGAACGSPNRAEDRARG